jgi:hypothetical protein
LPFFPRAEFQTEILPQGGPEEQRPGGTVVLTCADAS